MKRTIITAITISALTLTTLIATGAPSSARSPLRKRKPTPTATATPTPTPTATSTPTPTPTPSPTPTNPPTPGLVPSQGAHFGAYVDPDARWTDNATAKNEVTHFESQIGRKVAINQHYYSWTNTFPSGLEEWDIANGRIPLVSWDGINLSTILSGSEDSRIRSRADGLRSLGSPVFLRWAWEMNGNWYPWSGYANNSSGATDGPAKYVAAWKRIHGIFRDRGVTNVSWVWCPNHENVPTSSWNSWRNYYPGDDYVDWVCIDGYNWGTSKSWSSWRSFHNLMSPIYNDYASRKPIMIGEVSSTELGGSKAAWIGQMHTDIKSRMPEIKAVLWFHVNKEQDWRADSSSSSLSAYRTMVNDTYFNP